MTGPCRPNHQVKVTNPSTEQLGEQLILLACLGSERVKHAHVLYESRTDAVLQRKGNTSIKGTYSNEVSKLLAGLEVQSETES